MTKSIKNISIPCLLMSLSTQSFAISKVHDFDKNISINAKRVSIELTNSTSGKFTLSESNDCDSKSALKNVIYKDNTLIQNSENCELLIKIDLPSHLKLNVSAGRAFLKGAGPLPNLYFSAGSGDFNYKVNKKSDASTEVSIGAGSVNIDHNESFMSNEALTVNVGKGDINFQGNVPSSSIKTNNGIVSSLKKIDYKNYKAHLSTGFGSIKLK